MAAGRTLMRVIPHLRLPALRAGADLSVVQLMGGFDSPTENNPVSSLHELAVRLGIRGHYLQLPLYAPSQAAARAMEQHYIRGGFERLWKRCTLVVTGVGITGEASLYRREGVMSRERMQAVVAAGAAGDFFGRWFDESGRFLDIEVNRRVISIPPEILKALPRKILVAQGEEKVAAIRGALATRLVDFLVTDERTAAVVL